VEPIPVKVTRYRCPCCPRTASGKARMVEHIGRCWLNPEARGCKTCEHFEPYGPEWSDGCAVGVDLSGQKPCPTCWGFDDPFVDGPCEDPDHVGNGKEIKPGPIVHCAKWKGAA
jgi:hypothetical protein